MVSVHYLGGGGCGGDGSEPYGGATREAISAVRVGESESEGRQQSQPFSHFIIHALWLEPWSTFADQWTVVI